MNWQQAQSPSFLMLHGLLTRAGVMSIHGTMSSFLAKGGTDATSTLMRDLLLGKVPRYEVPAHKQNITGKASGTLVGGKICTFVPNLGTQADATKGNDLILFIEEVEESMHNIDRQMRILQMNDVNLPLVMGANVTIDVRADGASLQFNIDGDQQQVNTADITAPATPAAIRMQLAGKME